MALPQTKKTCIDVPHEIILLQESYGIPVAS